jgi:hypothetical protein
LDTLAKTRLLEQAKNEGIESLIVTSAIELKFMDLQSTLSINKVDL